MPRDIFYKTLGEKALYVIDFVADTPSGASISTSTATATSSDGTVVSSTVVGTCTSSGTVVTTQLKATAVDKETYLVVVKVTFNDALPTVAERIVEVRVRDGDFVE